LFRTRGQQKETKAQNFQLHQVRFLFVYLTVGYHAMHKNFPIKALGKCLKQTLVDDMFNKYFNFYPHSTIGYWHDTVVSLSVRPSVCDAVHCG